jgi:hypothetical protein
MYRTFLAIARDVDCYDYLLRPIRSLDSTSCCFNILVLRRIDKNRRTSLIKDAAWQPRDRG